MVVAALKVHGSYRGVGGYDRHTRAFVRELDRQGVKIRLQDVGNPAGLKLADLDPWFASLSRPVGARIAIHFTMPHEVRPEPGLLTVNHTMFEATPVHSTWVAYNRRHDLLLVPSESSRQAWIAGGMPPEKMRLSPLGVDPGRFRNPSTPLPLRRDNGVPVAEYRVRFLNVSAVGPRKNVGGLLRVWLRATSRDDDAILLLKLGLYWPGTYEALCIELDAIQRQVGKRLTDAAPVQVLPEILPDAAMPALYAAATHYISLSHGEGWDLPMMEAGAAGLRLIAPDHSAYPAYLDSSIADMIPSRQVPSQFQGDPYFSMLFESTRWWDADEDAAVALVRAAIGGREAPKASAQERILRDFTWEQATRRLIAALGELEERSDAGARGRWLRRHKAG